MPRVSKFNNAMLRGTIIKVVTVLRIYEGEHIPVYVNEEGST